MDEDWFVELYHEYPRVALTSICIRRVEDGIEITIGGNDTGGSPGYQDIKFHVGWDATCELVGSQHQWFEPSTRDSILGYELEYEAYHVDSIDEFLGAPLEVQALRPALSEHLSPFLSRVVNTFLESPQLRIGLWDGTSEHVVGLNEMFQLTQEEIPPEARRAVEDINEEILKVLHRYPEMLHEVAPRLFERLIAKLLERMGFLIELTAYQKDGGRDIIAVRHNALGDLDRYLIECKRYAPEKRVGVEIVRSLIGIRDLDPATRYCVVTTSQFTRGAREIEKKLWYCLSLKDYDDIRAWLGGNEVG